MRLPQKSPGDAVVATAMGPGKAFAVAAVAPP